MMTQDAAAGQRAAQQTGMRLRLPAEFRFVPLEADLPERLSSQLRLLHDLADGDARQRGFLSLYLEAMAVQMRRAQVAAAAFCAVALHGEPSTASLTVAFHRTGTTDRTLALTGAAAALQHPDAAPVEVETRQVAGHPAVCWEAERPLEGEAGPGAGAAGGQEEPEGAEGAPRRESLAGAEGTAYGTGAAAPTVREGHVLLQQPGTDLAVLLTLGTPMPVHWPTYRTVLQGVADTVSFGQRPPVLGGPADSEASASSAGGAGGGSGVGADAGPSEVFVPVPADLEPRTSTPRL